MHREYNVYKVREPFTLLTVRRLCPWFRRRKRKMPSHLYLYRLCAQSVWNAVGVEGAASKREGAGDGGGAGDGEVTKRSTHLPRKFCKLSQYSEHKYRFFCMFASPLLRPTTSHAAAHGFCGSVQFIHFAPHSILHLLLLILLFSLLARFYFSVSRHCAFYILCSC